MMKPILAIIGGFVLAFGMFVGGLLFAVVFFMQGEPYREPFEAASVSDVWTAEPRTVDVDGQNFKRVPAAPGSATDADASQQTAAPADQTDIAEPAVDTITTAALPPVGEGMPAEEPVAEGSAAVPEEPVAEEPVDNPAAARLLQAHQEWCARRYRSYNAGDNSYSPYSGGLRECFSPYAAEYAALSGATAASDPNVRFAPPTGEEPSDAIGDAVDAGREFAPDDPQGFVAREASGVTVIDDRHVRNCFSRYQSYRPEDNTYQPFGGGPRRQCE